MKMESLKKIAIKLVLGVITWVAAFWIVIGFYNSFANADDLSIYCSNLNLTGQINNCLQKLVDENHDLRKEIEKLKSKVNDVQAYSYQTQSEIDGLTDIVVSKKKKK